MLEDSILLGTIPRSSLTTHQREHLYVSLGLRFFDSGDPDDKTVGFRILEPNPDGAVTLHGIREDTVIKIVITGANRGNPLIAEYDEKVKEALSELPS